MWFDRLLCRNVIKISQLFQEIDVFWTSWHFARKVEKIVREAGIELVSFLDISDITGTQLQPKSFNVRLQVADFPTAEDWEYVGRL